jgi:hypothetical protein
MSSTYAGASTFPANITIPDDGDPLNASSVNVPLEGLADRTVKLKDDATADAAALAAHKTGTDHDTRYPRPIFICLYSNLANLATTTFAETLLADFVGGWFQTHGTDERFFYANSWGVTVSQNGTTKTVTVTNNTGAAIDFAFVGYKTG